MINTETIFIEKQNKTNFFCFWKVKKIDIQKFSDDNK